VKTTIELSDGLLERAKQYAAQRNLSLRAVVETALRQHLDSESNGRSAPFRLRRSTFAGRGLQAGIDAHDWPGTRKRIYARRGG
jgi:predicted transcriptional regulator